AADGGYVAGASVWVSVMDVSLVTTGFSKVSRPDHLPMRRTRRPARSIVCAMTRIRRAPAMLVAVMLLATVVSACGGGSSTSDVVTVNGGEPQNPLIPTNTNETNGGRIVDRLFAGLMSYDSDGNPSLEVAQTIESTDNVNYRITLKPGWTFTDGSPVTARSFVDAWNYGALTTNGQLQQSFFSPIEGYDDVAP